MLRKIIKNIIFILDPIRYYRSQGVVIGNNVRIIEPTKNKFGSEPYLIKIGNDVTISAGVRFVTHDGGVSVFRNEYPNIDVFGKITIDSNVFIGLNSIVLPNVDIGKNSVVGAGSVVTKNVPAGAIVAGVPAKQISSVAKYKDRVLKKAHFVREISQGKKRSYLEGYFHD